MVFEASTGFDGDGFVATATPGTSTVATAPCRAPIVTVAVEYTDGRIRHCSDDSDKSSFPESYIEYVL